MIYAIVEFIVVMLSAATFENIIFTRAIGVDNTALTLKNRRHILIYGGLTTLVQLAAVFMNILVKLLMKNVQLPAYIKNIVYLSSVLISYLVIMYLIKYFNTKFYDKIKYKLLIASLSGCVYGTVLIISMKNCDFLDSIAYALGSGLGFTLSLLMIKAGRERLAVTKVPKAFKGLPITLMYLGVLSLAIYGLIGHQLPS